MTRVGRYCWEGFPPRTLAQYAWMRQWGILESKWWSTRRSGQQIAMRQMVAVLSSSCGIISTKQIWLLKTYDCLNIHFSLFDYYLSSWHWHLIIATTTRDTLKMLLVISFWKCQRLSISSHVSHAVYGRRWVDAASVVSLFSQAAKGHHKDYQLDGCHLWHWYLSIAIGCDLLSEICFQAMVLCEKDTLWRRVRAAPMKKTCYDLLLWMPEPVASLLSTDTW